MFCYLILLALSNSGSSLIELVHLTSDWLLTWFRQDTSEVNYPYIGCRAVTPENQSRHFHKNLSSVDSLVDIDYLEDLFRANPTVQSDTCDFYVSTTTRRKTCRM